MHRSSTSNFQTLVNSPLTVLALAGAALVWLALLQPWGGLMRLFGIYPAIRAAMAGTGVAAGLGGVLGGVGAGRGRCGGRPGGADGGPGRVAGARPLHRPHPARRRARRGSGRRGAAGWLRSRRRGPVGWAGDARDRRWVGRLRSARQRVRRQLTVRKVLPWNPVDRVITWLIGTAVRMTATDDTGAGLGPFSTDDQAHFRHRGSRLLAG